MYCLLLITTVSSEVEVSSQLSYEPLEHRNQFLKNYVFFTVLLLSVTQKGECGNLKTCRIEY